MPFVPRSRKSGYALRPGGPQRLTRWADIATVETTLAGAPTAVLTNSLGAVLLQARPFTVIRTRGIMLVRSDQVSASETFGVDLGFAVVSEQASAIGVTAVPTPLTDKESDLFFVYESLFGHINVGSGAGTGVPDQQGGQFMKFDSKAMRKINDDQELVVVVENEIAGAIVTVTGRFLIKLH